MSEVIKITYGGINLSDLFDSITNIKRNIGATWANNLDGTNFINNSLGTRTISFDFTISGTFFDEINHNKELLSSYLNVREETPLIFEDEPNKVWYSLPDGDQTIDLNSGTLTFLVPSGSAVSSYTNVLNNSNSGGELGTVTDNGDGTASVIINNKGTLPTFLRAKISLLDENGFLRIVGVNGILEMGNAAEVDGVDATKSEMLLNAVNNVASDYSGFSPTTRTYALGSTNRPNNGTMAYQTDGLRLTNGGTGTSWHQADWVFTLPKDSSGNLGASSFISNFNAVFETGSVKQLGYLHVMLTDSNDNTIMGYAISKSSPNNNSATVNFYYQDVDNPGNFLSYTTRPNFQASGVNVKENPGFYHTQGHAEMIKQGAQLGWLYNGKKYTVNIPDLANSSVTKIHVEMGAFGTAPKIGNMALRRIWFQKTNVQYWSDIPNRFKAGSTLEANMEEGKIYLDERPAMDLKVNGSTFYSVPPGTSELLISGSDWFTGGINLNFEWEERYL
ncbi:distal tail protein Dit [Lactococcus fujiensis]|uniref:Phage tail protein n=1 Tax=Lactococcus fujiensis JCM 16395 TaxID=1291764 RepID=A0A2A5RIS3_9LACT|nr:distal tail protein Dit [Lactococcus fujiensis]PCR98997.1 phage tail protein [Lactococcus fujiensis JCM 16395]